MNNTRLITLLAILFFFSCRPVEVQNEGDQALPQTFSAKVGDVVDLHGPWSAGDRLSVFGSSSPVRYVYNTSGKLFQFEGDEPPKAGSGQSCYYALTPETSDSWISPGKFKVFIPENQKCPQQYLPSESCIMVAASKSMTDQEMTFHSATGFIKAMVPGMSTVKSVTLTGNKGEIISGGAELKAEYASVPELKMTGQGKKIVLDCSSGVPSSAESIQSFVFSVPGITFENGVTLSFDTEDGEVVMEYPDALTVIRGRISEINFGGTGTTFRTFGLKTSDGKVYQSKDVSGSEISVCVPYGTDMKSLTPVFSHDGKTVEMADKGVVASGKTPVNFTSPVSFKVISRDGKSSSYTVNAVDHDIPVVYISTPNHTPIKDRETWIAESTFIIQNPDGTIVDYGAASIKGRGNASWSRDKKSYSIKLAVKPKEQGVLGLPGHKRWCMIAVQWGYLGNNVGYELARRTSSFAWQPHGKYVEFVLNGKHVGTYFLAEHIRIDDNRVNIKSLKPEDVGADKISGGYLLTYDRTYNDPVKFKSKYFDMPVMIKDPDDDEIVPAQFDWIQNYINEMEAAMHDDARFAKGEYMDYLDIDTYIDMWFVWEIAGATGSHGGADFAHPNSVWFHKDRNGKLKAGPCWDFDSYLFSTQKILCNKGQYYGRLFQDPAFKARVKQKWPEFRASVEGKGKFATPITQYIDSCANVVRHSAERNQKMWTWTFYQLDTEHKTIREGLPAKMDYMEKHIESL